jgi:tripartite-type tricarboxylate transporter receptor subunit TctC
MFATSPSVLALVKAGRLRALAATGDHRIASLPDVPTMAESGHPAVTVRDWHGVVASGGTPPAVIERLSAAIGKVLALPPVQQHMATAGLEPVGTSGPAEFRAFMAQDMERWSAVIRSARITVQ